MASPVIRFKQRAVIEFIVAENVKPVGYLEKGTTINSVRYMETLGRLKKKKEKKRVQHNFNQVLLQYRSSRPYCRPPCHRITGTSSHFVFILQYGFTGDYHLPLWFFFLFPKL